MNAMFSALDGVLYNHGQTVLLCCPGGKTGSVAIPESVTSIGSYAFSGCAGVTEIRIPAGVTEIGSAAFGSCGALSAIEVDGGNGAYKSRDGILYAPDGTELLACPAGKSGALAVPDGVSVIADNAFSGCESLTSVQIQSMVYIGYRAFNRCTNLEHVFFTRATGTAALDTISEEAFANCMNLKEVTIPEGVVYIGRSAFENCVSLNGLILPVSLRCIDYEAFDRCLSLKSAAIPGGAAQWAALNLGSGNGVLLSAAKVSPGDSVSVSFEANGGGGTMSALESTAGANVTLPECAFTPPEGGMFRAWSIRGAEYAPGSEYAFQVGETVSSVWDTTQ